MFRGQILAYWGKACENVGHAPFAPTRGAARQADDIKEMTMWGKISVVIVVAFLVCAGGIPDPAGATGKNREIAKEGRYRGTVTRLQTVRCSSDPGDKRYCKRVYLAVGPGAPLTSRLHLYTEIARKGKVIYPGPNEDKSLVDQINSMDRLVGKAIKPNTKASLSVSCDDGGCLIDRIDLN